MHDKNYEIVSHKILTEDGYTLIGWRLRNKRKSQIYPYPVILMHGLLDCSMSWFVNKYAKFCLPCILADLGMDVWILNNRGNIVSCDS